MNEPQSDTTNVIVPALAALALVLYGRRRGGASGAVLQAGGVALAVGTLVGPGGSLLRRAGARRRRVDIARTFTIPRSVAEVFDFVRDFQNFPRLVKTLESVTDSQDGRSHWVVRSPTGARLEWDAAVTKYVPNQVIAWRSLPGAAVTSEGVVRLASRGANETQVELCVTYEPAETQLRDAVRALTGRSNTDLLSDDIAQAMVELPGRMSEFNPLELGSVRG
ncbi:MAG: hypothetical protein JWO05_3385 [Gemmatimonadetes bacterium]|nr:hypothetical protein [Gemmatimonadota bacterium]